MLRFSVYALRRIGLTSEAWGFLAWALDAASHGGRPQVLYDLDGRPAPAEREDNGLEGYRGSRPVRWGNAAAGQRQHDVYGEILDCAYQWAAGGAEIGTGLWRRLCELVDAAGREWQEASGKCERWAGRSPTRPRCATSPSTGEPDSDGMAFQGTAKSPPLNAC